jgi:hypothetical protein
LFGLYKQYIYNIIYISKSTQLNDFHTSKLFIWHNYVKSHFTEDKYESWKSCNIWGSFHVCESFTKNIWKKNKSEYNNGFCLNLPALSVWSNMSNTIKYLHQTLKTDTISKSYDASSSPMMSDGGRTCPTRLLKYKTNN